MLSCYTQVVDIGSWLSAVAEQGIRGWCIVSMNTQSHVQLPDELGQYSTNIELFHMNIAAPQNSASHSGMMRWMKMLLLPENTTKSQYGKPQTTVSAPDSSTGEYFSGRVTVFLQAELWVVSSILHCATSLAVRTLHFDDSSAVTTAVNDCMRYAPK